MPTLKIQNAKHRQMTRARVARVERTTRHFVTVTFTSDALDGFEFLGDDQCIRVFFPRVGQSGLRMPTASGNGWIAQFYLIPAASRPHVRNYTVRAFRPASAELDIEFVVHGDDSPASFWATHAQPGDEAGLFPEGKQYLPHSGAEWQLLVGDESAVPAILSILEQSDLALRAEVFLEVPSAEDIRPTPARDGVTVHWLPRDGRPGTPGRYALETVSRAKLPIGEPASFIVGESGLATGLRRHLVSERGFAKSGIIFIGYWKSGRAALG